MNWLHHIRSFRGSAAGTALIEAALTIPLLIYLVTGTIELCRYAQFQQKLEDSAQKMVNLLNQQPYLLSTEIDSLQSVASDVMSPFTVSNICYPSSSVKSPGAICIYVSAIQQNAPPSGTGNCKNPPSYMGTQKISCPADVMWQVMPTGQSKGPGSQIAPKGGCTGSQTPVSCPQVTTLPGGQSWETVLQQKDQAIVVEIYLQYTPLLNIPGINLIENTAYHYQMAFATPRLGQFQSPPAGSIPQR